MGKLHRASLCSADFYQNTSAAFRWLMDTLSVMRAFLSRFGNVLEMVCDYSVILKRNFCSHYTSKSGLENGLGFTNVAEKPSYKSLGMSSVKVFVRRGTILKSDRLKTISNSFIEMVSFVPSGLASDL